MELLTKEFLIENYLNQNKSTRDVALLAGVSQWTIRKYLKKYDLKVRTVRQGLRTFYKSHILSNGNIKRKYIYNCDGKKEHRAIMEKSLGRKLSRYEIVHHIDADPYNNNIDNLYILSASEHAQYGGWLIKNYSNKDTFSKWLLTLSK